MAKPTFLQSLLNKPTQSYAFPAPKKEYHSQKREFMRIAKDARSEQDPGPSAVGPSPDLPTTNVIQERQLYAPDSSSDSDSSSGEDIFYTPNSSPRNSLISHTDSSLLLRLIREDSVDSMTSTTATTTDSLFSHTTRSDSTRLTTPVTSDAGHYRVVATKSDVTFTNVGSSSQLPVPPTGLPPRRTTRRPTHDNTPDSWSKDVRWLVSPTVASKQKSASSNLASTSKRRPMPDNSKPAGPAKPLRRRRSKSLIDTSPRSPQIHLPPVPQPYVHRRSKSASPRKSKTVMSMTALVEVEEPSETNELHHALMGRDRTRTHSLLQTPSKLHLKSQPSRSRVSSSPSTPPQPPEHNPAPRSQYTTSSRTVTLPNPLPISTNTHGQNLPSSGTPGYTSLVLPRAAYPKPKASSKLGFGFGVLGGGEVDLTKGGMAQTTMATVEVVQGIAKAGSSGLASNSATKAARRKTLPRSFTMPTFLRGSGSLKGKEKAVDESPLAFTSWRKPPGYVGANGVLVQIWAVAVDAIDQVLVKGATPSSSSSGLTSPSTASLSPGKKKAGKKDGESTKKAEVGFIPGRSFVGRVLECGWEVGEEVIKKNDWVVGLLDVKKCGAMAEFVVVDRRRLHRVPYPRMPSNSANPDTSTHAQPLTLEELALLPLAGVPAHRAVRTFTSVKADAISTPRALVLGGHDGVGAMAVQMLARRGWRVCVHVPVPTHLPTIPGVSRLYIDEESRRIKYLEKTEEVIRSWGAEEVLFIRQHDDDAEGRDGAVKLMERLTEAEEEFDGVLDTIGGKEVWDAGEALLACRSGGRETQFTTLVGDAPDRIVPTTSDLFKTGVRSTKKHGTGNSAVNRRYSTDSGMSDGRKSKTKTKVGYAWVMINQDVDWQGEDIADSLRAVIRGAAADDGVRPLVVGDKVVPFEKTPEMFVGGLLDGGGTVVVNVVS